MGKNDASEKIEFGSIAQDNEAVLNASEVPNPGMLSCDSNGMLSLRYNDLIAPMVIAIQEQQSIIQRLLGKI